MNRYTYTIVKIIQYILGIMMSVLIIGAIVYMIIEIFKG